MDCHFANGCNVQVEWNKGHALSHLLQSLSLSNASDVLPIYIGDDRTDEDAFAVLTENSRGVGILVSTKVFLSLTSSTYQTSPRNRDISEPYMTIFPAGNMERCPLNFC